MNANNLKWFKDVAFVVYPVADVPRARHFYEEVLGLVATANWDNQWVEYDIGGGTLAITVADEKHRPGAAGATVGLEVKDFDLMLAHLQAQAVTIANGPFDSAACRGCAIRDPDGNEIILHARR